MKISRMYVREILAHIDRAAIEPEVLEALEAFANEKQPPREQWSSQVVATITERLIESATGMPAYVPLVYTDAQLAKLVVDGRPATQADVNTANDIKRRAHEEQWRVAQAYRPVLNASDAINAAFAEPDLPTGYGVIEAVAIGAKNSAGDVCLDVHAGVSVYRCSNGHGYQQSRSLRSCPACFSAGGRSDTVEEDRGAILSEDSRW